MGLACGQVAPEIATRNLWDRAEVLEGLPTCDSIAVAMPFA